MPPLGGLRCFEAAARHESFSRAAEELNLTHGAVSRAVRAVETELGTKLFDRRSRRVFLNADGERLHKAISQAFDLIGDAAHKIRARTRHTPLLLSCEPTLLMRWLIPRLPSFHAAYPEIPVRLVAGGGPFSFGGGIDLAIRRNDFDWGPAIHAAKLFDEQVGPICSPGRVEAFFERSDHARLRDDAMRLHAATRPDAWSSWAELSASATAGAEPEEHVFEHFYFSLQAAVAGLGVAIGPYQLVRDDIAAGLLVAPMDFVEDGSSYFLLSDHKIEDGTAEARLLDWLRSVA
ncbi:LysR family transcriptional regulator [Sphingomonas oleivorans]|nr:LysR family transcriptional regulator [Sphingomonas oleivorans]